MNTISKLLLDNIDTLNGIAKGRRWQFNPIIGGQGWSDAKPEACPIRCLINGQIRLVPEKKWVDFSHAPEKRPKMAILESKESGALHFVVFRDSTGCWQMGNKDTYCNDLLLFNHHKWHHEDGTVTPFGVEVEW